MLYRASEVHCFGCVQGEGIGGEEGEGNWGDAILGSWDAFLTWLSGSQLIPVEHKKDGRAEDDVSSQVCGSG